MQTYRNGQIAGQATKGKKGADKGKSKGKDKGGGKGKKGKDAGGNPNAGDPNAGLKPPEVAAVEGAEEPAAAKAKGRGGKKKNFSSGTPDSTWTIDDGILSLVEQIDPGRNAVDRVCNTMELMDYFRAKDEGRPGENLCYSVSTGPPLSRAEINKVSGKGLGALLDRLAKINPEFAQFSEIKELDSETFIQREYQRPAGYSAQSRVHMGRLCVPVLADSGATCCCITEEQVVLLVNHVHTC